MEPCNYQVEVSPIVYQEHVTVTINTLSVYNSALWENRWTFIEDEENRNGPSRGEGGLLTGLHNLVQILDTLDTED